MLKRKEEAEAEMERIRKEIAFIIGDVNIGSNCSTNDLILPHLRYSCTSVKSGESSGLFSSLHSFNMIMVESSAYGGISGDYEI